MKNSILVLFGNLLYALAYWFILLYFIRIESPELLGAYGLILSITTPLIIFLNFQVRSIQAVDVNSDYQFYEYNIFRINTFILGVFLIILLSFIFNISYFFFISVGIMKLIDSLSEVNYGFFQIRRKIKFIPVFKALKSLIILSFLSIGYLFELGNISIIFLCISIAFLVVYLIELYIISRYIKVKITGKWNISILKKIAIYGFPLMIATFLGSLNSNIPRYVLVSLESLKEVGYYTAFVYLISVGNLFVSSVAQVYVTPLASIWQSNDKKKIKKSLRFVLFRVASILVFFGCLTYFFADFIIITIFDESYLSLKIEFILTIIAALISYLGAIFGYFNIATKKFKELVKLSIIWIVATLFSSIICISYWGLLGAFISLIISNLVILLTRLRLLFTFIRLVKEN